MIAQPSAEPALRFTFEQSQHAEAIEALLDHAFGPGRFTKVSERVREIAEFRPDLSVCAWDGERLVGSVRMWKVHVGAATVLFLGPLAVEADARKHGTGGLLVQRAVQAAEAAGFPVVLLVGDEPYFGRFGFTAAPARQVRMPGPVDQRRVLARGAELLAGPVTA
ncbi:GNAT family N-acetyltransferase [Phenylobacterium sp.]|uniref:GNAT family N-acetyltransferase n=1 Tax=Phenylobacterium sp. TaxID=1871053 RepID=UPI002733B96A|nr:N-acetyltransferase [Phenylobacterium sp.]MDP3853058.1 N-acetyltransferase [Phenylobacterium sp.]